MRASKCNGDPRFTEDRITPAVAIELAEICSTCDVALLCRQYPNVADPKIGYWAGHRYGVPGRKTRRGARQDSHARRGREGSAPGADPWRVSAAEKRIAWCAALTPHACATPSRAERSNPGNSTLQRTTRQRRTNTSTQPGLLDARPARSRDAQRDLGRNAIAGKHHLAAGTVTNIARHEGLWFGDD